MGLDTSHNCWHGPYSAFTRWRTAVARAAGYDVVQKVEQGFPFDEVQIDWTAITEAHLQGAWMMTPADPLVVLIAHSDCDGYIHPAQAAPLADRLEALLPQLSDGGPLSEQFLTRRFIQGLRLAVARNELVEFR